MATSAAEEILKGFARAILLQIPAQSGANNYTLPEALKQLHDEIIDLIGSDEKPDVQLGTNSYVYSGAAEARNELKAKLRTKVDEYFGRQGWL